MKTVYARFPKSKMQHYVVPDTNKTACGKDTTGAAKYGPFKGNLNKDCPKCLENKKKK